jgi:tetratricopeptide (TPR) repeat protein
LGLCDLYRRSGSVAQAQTLCREALAKLQKLSAADPGSGEFRSDVANAMRLLGDVELAAGDAATALTQERSALDLLHAMPEADRDENLQLYSLQARVTAGEAELKLGDTREAITDFQTAAAIGDKLVARDPDHAYDRLDRARANTHLALALAANGQCAEAEPRFGQASAEWTALREMGVVNPAEVRQVKALEAAMQKCRP